MLVGRRPSASGSASGAVCVSVRQQTRSRSRAHHPRDRRQAWTPREFVGARDVVGQEGLDRVFEVLRAPYAEEPILPDGRPGHTPSALLVAYSLGECVRGESVRHPAYGRGGLMAPAQDRPIPLVANLV